MKRTATLLVTVTAALLGLAGPVRADSVWFYQTTATDDAGTSSVLWASVPTPGVTLGGIELIAPSYGLATGNREVVITNLRTFSCAPGAAPDRYVDAGYRLTMTLLDVASNTFAALTFTGILNGTVSHEMADVRNTFTGETTYKVRLGDNVYTVTLGHFAPPGPPSSGLLGSITTIVTVDAVVTDAPEPSTLALGGVACVMLGLATWRKRRAAK